MPNENARSDPPNNREPAGQNPPAPDTLAQPVENTIGDVRAGRDTHMVQAGTMNVVVMAAQAQQIKSGKGWVGTRKRGGGLAGSPDRMVRKVGHVMDSALSDVAYAGDEKADAEQGSKTPPETTERIRDWYRNCLNDLEKCFVQAAAVLSGAPENEVRRATSELYKPILAEARRQATRRPQSDDIPAASESIILDEHFQAKTYTTVRKVEGARRVFWQDATANGFSTFAVRVLGVIEAEAPIGSQTGQGFLEQLEQLPRKFEGESAWRVPRALGGLWLNSDESQFLRMADEWIGSEVEDDWWEWRIANLLDGAYEVEYKVLGEKVAQTNKSVVLGLVSSWITEAHTSAHDAQRTRLGCTVAKVCGLIGQRCLQPALRDLDSLLSFPLNEEGNDTTLPEDVFIEAIWSYVTLARYGAVRKVLAHLASNVERLSRERRDRAMRNPWEYLSQRSITLSAMLNAFTFLAILSFREEQEITRGMYSRTQPVPEYPRILDNEQGQDVLLAGILAKEETMWRQHITTILCALIVEGNIDLAFYLMRGWADDVLRERGPESLALRDAYIQFMVDVVHQADEWGNHLRRAGYRQRYILKPCKEVLEQWRKESSRASSPQPLGAFTKDVIKAIDTCSNQ